MPQRSREPRKSAGRSKQKAAFLDGLNPEEAQAVLGRLLAAHTDLSGEAEQIARSLLRETSFESVAEQVEDAVRALDVDDLSGRAGRHAGGYVEPDQAALDLMSEAVDPYLEDMKRKLEFGLEPEALEICKGIVLGLYRFHKRGSELRDYAPEFPEEHAGWVVDIWRAGGDEDKAARRARPLAGKGPTFPRDFVDRFVPEWAWLAPAKGPRR